MVVVLLLLTLLPLQTTNCLPISTTNIGSQFQLVISRSSRETCATGAMVRKAKHAEPTSPTSSAGERNAADDADLVNVDSERPIDLLAAARHPLAPVGSRASGSRNPPEELHDTDVEDLGPVGGTVENASQGDRDDEMPPIHIAPATPSYPPPQGNRDGTGELTAPEQAARDERFRQTWATMSEEPALPGFGAVAVFGLDNYDWAEPNEARCIFDTPEGSIERSWEAVLEMARVFGGNPVRGYADLVGETGHPVPRPPQWQAEGHVNSRDERRIHLAARMGIYRPSALRGSICPLRA